MAGPITADSADVATPAVLGTHTSAAAGGNGISGVSNAGTGVHGKSVTSFGVHGESTTGRGVVAISDSDYGLRAASRASAGLRASSVEGRGVEGWATKGEGVVGISTTGNGVWGQTEGSGIGVLGSSGRGIGVYGKGGRLAGFFEGNVEVTGDLTCTNADCAEDFDLADTAVDGGTVMVLNEDGALHESSNAYDPRVAGVVSGAGDFRPGIILDRHAGRLGRKAIALMGKVYCKVDAEAAPIAVGDLLTSSTVAGHAMKACDRERAFGAVIGKALQPLAAGCGLIPILVALQ